MLEIPSPDTSVHFENGSIIEILYVFQDFFYVMPVGNWSLFTELVDAVYGDLPSANFTWDSNSTYWGYTLKLSGFESSVKMTRSDGVLYSYDASMDLGALGYFEGLFQRLSNSMDSTLLLIIVGGAIAVVVIVIIFAKPKT